MKSKFSCDFETTTTENDCRVWAWGASEIGNSAHFEYGNSIEDFIEWLKKQENSTCYFHNEKFDGEFIISHLLKNGYKWVAKKKFMTTKTFTTIIADTGQFYALQICFKKHGNNKIYCDIYDSLKLLPFSVEQIAKAFGLKQGKLTLDYKKYREVGHKLTDDEIEYLKADCVIVSEGLNYLFNEGLTKMTTASNAMEDYKNTIGKNVFKHWFPPPKYDSDIRQAYKGGYTYVAERYRGVEMGRGLVLDVNSLYPYVMRSKLLPCGEGKFFKGKYKKDELYPLYIQQLTCNFELKENHIPIIQLKHLRFCPTEYLTSSDGEDVTLTLTNVDLELFFEHYNVYNIEWRSGWKFRGACGMFNDYIDKWINVKNQATLDGNKSMRTIAKLMLNSLYGKFALHPKLKSKMPTLVNGVVKYENLPSEEREPIYVPMGCFITAYAREKTIKAAQKNYNRFIYCDTDSLHLIGDEIPDGLDIDDVELGAWKIEKVFDRGKFLRAKTYIEEVEGKLEVTCAGMPNNCHSLVTWENFTYGAKYEGKLIPRHCEGGIVLVETDFTIKP